MKASAGIRQRVEERAGCAQMMCLTYKTAHRHGDEVIEEELGHGDFGTQGHAHRDDEHVGNCSSRRGEQG